MFHFLKAAQSDLEVRKEDEKRKADKKCKGGKEGEEDKICEINEALDILKEAANVAGCDEDAFKCFIAPYKENQSLLGSTRGHDIARKLSYYIPFGQLLLLAIMWAIHVF